MKKSFVAAGLAVSLLSASNNKFLSQSSAEAGNFEQRRSVEQYKVNVVDLADRVQSDERRPSVGQLAMNDLITFAQTQAEVLKAPVILVFGDRNRVSELARKLDDNNKTGFVYLDVNFQPGGQVVIDMFQAINKQVLVFRPWAENIVRIDGTSPNTNLAVTQVISRLLRGEPAIPPEVAPAQP